jgi:cell division GTPase FtsZ
MTRFLDTETFDYPKNKLMFIVDQKNNQDEIDFEDNTDYRILFLIIDDVVKEIQILDGFFI